ncbi:MAG: hypothetical protein M0016_05720 [Deltaproteobacteria bacterium]|jgi:hypothetical protein|nr:hypothetical protein [Deltaproteobacteria bacterium]MCL5880460.1 hypothetical protein [Deltaproteobacteria bacterium]MDA8304641.1 hypothetical protein [Deltaproteobacteria bacterium]
MKIIPQIETPAGENYINFEENLSKLIEGIKYTSKKFGLNGPGEAIESYPVVIEQNFGINALLLCNDLKNRHNNLNIIYAFNMRDKNRVAILSDLITLKQLGLKDIIISEGLHPLKTVFYAAKPVYDIDVLGLSSIIKTGFPLLKDNEYVNNFSLFNLGVVVGVSTQVDFLKIKKLSKIGVDSFVINYFGDNLDINIINYIKAEKKPVFIFVNESNVKSTLEEFIKKNLELNVDGVIIKISNEKSNIFTQD